MTSNVIQQQFEAALQRLIENQRASSKLKISCDGVTEAELQRRSPSSKPPEPKVRAPKDTSQHVQTGKDEAN
jgi:hypothetical protein